MISKGNAPNAHEKRYQQAVIELGCVVTMLTHVQLHHIWGATFKHNKQKIGHYAVLALSPTYHDVSSNNEFNVTHHKKAFHDKFGSNAFLIEKTLKLVELGYGAETLPSQLIIDAMLDWGKRN